MINEIGTPIWTDEEIAAEQQKLKDLRFFKDEETKEVVLTAVEKEEKVGKISGNPYTLHTYYFQDVEGREKKLVDYDFSMTNAFGKLKSTGIVPKIGMKLSVSAKSLGIDEKGYEKFTYSLEVSDSASPAATKVAASTDDAF